MANQEFSLSVGLLIIHSVSRSVNQSASTSVRESMCQNSRQSGSQLVSQGVKSVSSQPVNIFVIQSVSQPGSQPYASELDGQLNHVQTKQLLRSKMIGYRNNLTR
jgi:hypothetical protein